MNNELIEQSENELLRELNALRHTTNFIMYSLEKITGIAWQNESVLLNFLEQLLYIKVVKNTFEHVVFRDDALDEEKTYHKNFLIKGALSFYNDMKKVREERKQKVCFGYAPSSKVDISSFNWAALYYTVGKLSKKAVFSMRTVPNTDERDCLRYYAAVGIDPRADKMGYMCDTHPKTRSTRMSISFKISNKEVIQKLYFPPNNNGSTIVSNDNYTYTCHNDHFCWSLIENYGLLLGNKQNIDRIRTNIDPKYINDFEEGLKEAN